MMNLWDFTEQTDNDAWFPGLLLIQKAFFDARGHSSDLLGCPEMKLLLRSFWVLPDPLKILQRPLPRCQLKSDSSEERVTTRPGTVSVRSLTFWGSRVNIPTETGLLRLCLIMHWLYALVCTALPDCGEHTMSSFTSETVTVKSVDLIGGNCTRRLTE